MLKELWVIFFLKQKKCCKIEKLGMGADVGLAAFFCGKSIRTMNVMGRMKRMYGEIVVIR